MSSGDIEDNTCSEDKVGVGSKGNDIGSCFKSRHPIKTNTEHIKNKNFIINKYIT